MNSQRVFDEHNPHSYLLTLFYWKEVSNEREANKLPITTKKGPRKASYRNEVNGRRTKSTLGNVRAEK
tara:strand:- start:565 stop:768 length:204 start_codon:yes stop_codon:yes gene_type:complete